MAPHIPIENLHTHAQAVLDFIRDEIAPRMDTIVAEGTATFPYIFNAVGYQKQLDDASKLPDAERARKLKPVYEGLQAYSSKAVEALAPLTEGAEENELSPLMDCAGEALEESIAGAIACEGFLPNAVTREPPRRRSRRPPPGSHWR
jgi:hypothetical protein